MCGMDIKDMGEGKWSWISMNLLTWVHSAEILDFMQFEELEMTPQNHLLVRLAETWNYIKPSWTAKAVLIQVDKSTQTISDIGKLEWIYR
jgi:hypothetical protein